MSSATKRAASRCCCSAWARRRAAARYLDQDLPVVVDDVRYLNEAAAIWDRGGIVVRANLDVAAAYLLNARARAEARIAAERFFAEGASQVVIKAQVLVGGRGKAGGVKVVKSKEELRREAERLLGATLVTHQTGPKGRLVRRLYVEDEIIDRLAALVEVWVDPAGQVLVIALLGSLTYGIIEGSGAGWASPLIIAS